MDAGDTYREGVTAGVRAAACLGVGMVLWVFFGAVRGAADWQVAGGGYVVGLLVAGVVFGLVAPVRNPRHLAAAGLLVIPGFATLVAAGPGAHPDAAWWFVSLFLGLFGAAGTHRLAVELRRALAPVGLCRRHRRSALAEGPHSQ